MTAATTRAVLCMKWGSAFPAETVNVLYRAVRHHLDTPTRFICITENAVGLDPGIETRGFEGCDLPARAWQQGAWPKVFVFKKDVLDFQGRVLFIDLDSFILRSLEPFFEPGPFRAIGLAVWDKGERRPPKPGIYRLFKPLIFHGARKLRLREQAELDDVRHSAKAREFMKAKKIASNRMGTGVFAFDANRLTHIWDRLAADFDQAVNTYLNEQHFVENQLDTWLPWAPSDVVSFKSHCRQPLLTDWVRLPSPPPEATRILAFHGDPRPYDLATRRISRWRELPHVRFGRPDWVRDYWERYRD